MSIQFDKVQPKTKEQLKQLINYAFKHDIYDLNFIDTSKITDMSLLFSNCIHNFDVSSWDVSNVVNMYCTFDHCKNFIGKGLENWNVSNVISMTSMFAGCEKFDCGLSNWDVSNVTNMNHMFYDCENFNCDLSNWDVSNVKAMLWMFSGCKDFKGKGLENWDVSKVKDMNYMFNNCDKITIPRWYKKYNL